MLSAARRSILPLARGVTIASVAASLTWLYGCAAPPDSGGTGNEGAATAPPPAETRPVAMVNDRPVRWSMIQPLLAEASGGAILQEVALNMVLEHRLAAANLEVSGDNIDAERGLLLETLSDSRDQAERLLAELRARRGLGENRFRDLLWRNAALRQLVSGQVEVTEVAITRMHEQLYGEKRQGRLIVVPTLSDAQRVLNELRQRTGQAPETGAAGAQRRTYSPEVFAEVATSLSTDTSAARGGLLEPIGRLDPDYPRALREALWPLRIGEVSDPVLLDDAYAIVQLVDIVPHQPVPLYTVRDRLDQLVRLSQQRVLMDQLARQLLTEASVTILNDELEQSWRMMRR